MGDADLIRARNAQKLVFSTMLHYGATTVAAGAACSGSPSMIIQFFVSKSTTNQFVLNSDYLWTIKIVKWL